MEIIKVNNVIKMYRRDSDKGHTLKEKLLFWGRNKREEKPILNGISLKIDKGETVGLIGENGCGKSTLLKLLTKIIYPNSGSIEIKGKVSSLLELGAGFHPDMTGRENIYTNASIFGLTRKEIDARVDDIIEFSELGEFIESPVRTYSSGMYMRLAFSVAISVEAEILLIDEILAVGDHNFQKKCFNKLKELKKQGVTIIIVSHDLGSIEKLCNTVVWIYKGKIRETGSAKQMIDKYLQHMNEVQEIQIEKSYQQKEAEKQNGTENKKVEAAVSAVEEEKKYSAESNISKYEDRWGGLEVEFLEVSMEGLKTQSKHCFESGESVKVRLKYKKHKDVEDYVFGIGISNSENVACYGTNTQIDGIELKSLKDSGVVEFVISELMLLEGKYSLDVAVHGEAGRAYDYIKKVYEFDVVTTAKDSGICRLKHEWIIS